MSRMVFLLIAVLMAGPVRADENARQAACKAEITKTVLAAGKLLGIGEDFRFEVAGTGRSKWSHLDERMDEYITTVFIVPGGYIEGSGALIAAKPTADSCKVLRMDIHAR
jgi:hypothetical protein